MADAVDKALGLMGLTGVILDEKPNMGRTLIQKFEDESAVGFAVVLLTGDDRGGLGEDGELKPRARQNVILELGYFLGKHGRPRTCLLLEPGVEMPSDLHGVGWIEIDAARGWEAKLGTELYAAGYAVDFQALATKRKS